MSSSDFYHNSKVSLPPLRDQLGDILDRPPFPRGEYDQRDSPSRSRGTSSETEYRLPPIQQYDSPPRSRSTYTSRPSPRSAYQPSQSPPRQSMYNREEEQHRQKPSHTYGLLRTSATGELVIQQSSTVDCFHNKPVRTSNGDSLRKHLCDECGERFDRPSTLDTHRRTHNGEKPFQCGHPNCFKTFTVKSNMRRHERTHKADSAFEIVEDHHSGGHPSARSSTHSHGGSSSRTQQSSAASPSYYSSKRR